MSHTIVAELWEWSRAAQGYTVVFVHSPTCAGCLKGADLD